ncbi:MAG: HNH endonuclease [Thermoleophilia bacterium]
MDEELGLRERIMEGLRDHLASSGGTITRDELTPFLVDANLRLRLIDASRGIWNPKHLAATLSIVSSPTGPYSDREENGLLRYAYRAGSTDGDNRKLRQAMILRLPLILLRKIDTGLYMPVFPVYVIADDLARREFVIALDESLRFIANPEKPEPPERRYAEQVAWRRLHQPEFRVKVLRAYDGQCTICRLRHRELLDAAHIIGDRHDQGDPVVPNGLSLCKIHHAAYDRDLLGITGDGEVRINQRLLDEVDGPMLLHGLQEMHGRAIEPPAKRRDRPDHERLDQRFQRFLSAA